MWLEGEGAGVGDVVAGGVGRLREGGAEGDEGFVFVGGGDGEAGLFGFGGGWLGGEIRRGGGGREGKGVAYEGE